MAQHALSPSPKRILIVEDATDIRQSLQELFESEGYVAQAAANGKEALTILRSSVELPNLILLDLMMPVMDGYQFREEQLKDTRLSSVPVLVMTADGNIAEKTIRVGAIAYIKKPLDVDHVLEIVDQYRASAQQGVPRDGKDGPC